MNVGTVIHAACWVVGLEKPEVVKQVKDEILAGGIAAHAREHGVLIGPVSFSFKKPGEEGVPNVPLWLEKELDVQGRKPVVVEGVAPPRGEPLPPLLLVAEATVTGISPVYAKSTFLSELTPEDLKVLRAITKRAHAQNDPPALPLTDMEADRIIEELGPDTAKNAILSQAVH